MRRAKLLLVDDDESLTELITESLSEKFNVISTFDADTAYRVATQNQPDGVLLDINLKQSSGLHLCERIRQNLLTKHIPIIVITGVGDRGKMLTAYDLGADDYIEKPIDMAVLENRLSSRLKRFENLTSKAKSIANMRLFSDRNEVELNGKVYRLSHTELSLLKLLLDNVNKQVTRVEIMRTIWTDAVVEERTIDVHISSLRRKLRGFDYRIEALYGTGYILRPQTSRLERKSPRI
jgi:DNA-binding response OmpR family regulator